MFTTLCTRCWVSAAGGRSDELPKMDFFGSGRCSAPTLQQSRPAEDEEVCSNIRTGGAADDHCRHSFRPSSHVAQILRSHRERNMLLPAICAPVPHPTAPSTCREQSPDLAYNLSRSSAPKRSLRALPTSPLTDRMYYPDTWNREHASVAL